MSSTPQLAVVYDRGAVEPGRIVRSLGDVADLHFLVPRSEHARSVLPFLEQHGSVRMVDRVLASGARYAGRFDGIVTFSEQMLLRTAQVAATLALDFSSPTTVTALTNKGTQRQQLATAGLDKVRQAAATDLGSLRSALDDLGLPAVVKPEVGEGSRHTYLVETAADAERLVTTFGHAWPQLSGTAEPFVVEEYLADAPADPRVGSYVSVESVVVGGRPVHLAITGKFPLAPPFRERGQFWPARPEPALGTLLLDLTGDALQALGVRSGLTHTELKLTPTGPRLIEVNGRLGGDVAGIADRATGLDLVRLAGEVALGSTEVHAPEPPEEVFFMYNHASPPGARAAVAVDGAEEVRSLNGVDEYFVWPLPQTVSPERSSPFDDVRGRASDHAAMYEIVARAGAALRIRFTTDSGGTIECSGLDLQ